MLFESWLAFDNSVFQWIGSVFQPGTSAVVDGIFKFITMLGDSGWFFIALAIVLMIPNKTRKVGVIIAGALVLDVIIVNGIMKNVFARPRPYDLEIEWWKQAYATVFPNGTLAEKPHDFSFPSGHTAGSFAGGLAFCLGCKPKWVGRIMSKLSVLGVVLAALIGFSRLYLGVHYPTDVFFGVLVGCVCAVLAMLLFRLLEPLYEKLNAPLVRFAEVHLPKFFW